MVKWTQESAHVKDWEIKGFNNLAMLSFPL